ncbi:serine/threonine-protein kinase mos-like [Acropora palmata]|uniref:serine/threonine-protein kinase mos-like n=1 Tax=Acropora palmata TaxID=6131 RepID=UPI003DA077F3
MVLQEVERTLCEGCKRRRKEMVFVSIQSGKFIASELQLGRLLGSGGFGSVYEAKFRGERLAIKKLHQETKNARAAQESFEAEGSILHFNHPNIVRSLATLTLWDDVQCIIMEFAGERNLHNVINDSFEELDRIRRVKFALDIVTALHFAHQQGLVHLDLKPGNVLVTSEDNCKLADFGCCRAVEENNKPSSPTKSNLTGTYAYRAPELLKGESPSTKADIYSLGICLWQMLTREQPYGNENQHVVIFGVVAYQLRPKIKENIAGDETYVNLIKQCWQAEVKFRPTANEIVNELQDMQSESLEFSNETKNKIENQHLSRICVSQVCLQIQ